MQRELFVTQKQFAQINAIFSDAGFADPGIEEVLRMHGINTPSEIAARNIAAMFNLELGGHVHYYFVVVNDGDDRVGTTSLRLGLHDG